MKKNENQNPQPKLNPQELRFVTRIAKTATQTAPVRVRIHNKAYYLAVTHEEFAWLTKIANDFALTPGSLLALWCDE